ncbi:MAG: PilT protein [Rhizobium sp.]|nr:PilT protein [Rhizobium sp.]
MTISTLVDTNVFIDVLGPASQYRNWSIRALEQCLDEGALVINPVIWSELASSPLSEMQLTSALGLLALKKEPISFEAAFTAGKAHRRYRLAGGQGNARLQISS